MRASGEGKAKAEKETVAKQWLATAPDDDELVPVLRNLPAAVLQKVRLSGAGHGQRIRSCLLCECNSNQEDPVLGERVMLMWGHIEEDGITI